MKEFILYVQSPLFNKNKHVLNLLSILKKHYPNFLHKKVNHEILAQQLFKTSAVQKLRYVMTDLTKLAEQFIAHKEAQHYAQSHLVNALQKRNLGKLFTQELNSTLSIIHSAKVRDEHFYKEQHDLSELSFQYTLKHDNRNIDSQLQEVVDNLDAYYLTKKLKYSCEVINRMNILNVNYNIQLLENLLDFLNGTDLTDSPAINTYFHVLKTLQEGENQAHYVNLTKLIKQHLELFKQEDQYDLFGYLQNYCIKQINSGNNNYLSELFRNYKEMIERKVVLKDKQISQFDFKNIVTVALRVEEFKWTEGFIESYHSYLPQEHAENAIAYNRARLYFSQKNYKQSRRELLSVEFTDIFYSLDSRMLLLKTYYEMEDYESATDLIKAFKIYLKRDKKISAYQNATYSGFLAIANKLVRYKLGYKEKKQAIEKQLQNASQIADSSWLKHQLSLLN